MSQINKDLQLRERISSILDDTYKSVSKQKDITSIEKLIKYENACVATSIKLSVMEILSSRSICDRDNKLVELIKELEMIQHKQL